MTTTYPYVLDTALHFEDRALRAVDDGSDFEAFVYETLAVHGDQALTSQLKPAHGRGRDGAIDLLDDTTSKRCVIECKFIGRNATTRGQHRWKDVYRLLFANVTSLLAVDPDIAKRSLYAPWIDRNRPICKYVFCVTEAFTHVRDEDDLREAIQRDFHNLSAVDSRLAHLEDVVVDIRGWGFFLAELSRRLPLRYRWFESLPPGVSHLLGQSPRKESFKQFLRAETLPFFSRSTFYQEQGSAWE